MEVQTTSRSVDRKSSEPDEAASPGRAPDFIIIGAMKSGTTTLYHYLCRHPGVFMPANKEPGYFSRADRLARGWSWYTGLFADARPDQLCGEASTCYTRHPHYLDAASQIAAQLPDIKLIYLMRHPVDRAFSHYRHNLEAAAGAGPVASMTFEQAIEHDRSIVDASRYMDQINHYLTHFDHSSLLPLVMDDLIADPVALLGGVQEFLGLERVDLVGNEPLVSNATKGGRWARVEIRRRVDAWIEAPGVRHALALLPISRDRIAGRLKRTLLGSPLLGVLQRKRGARLPSMTDADRARMLELLDQPTRELEAFLGRELPDWHQ